jgi:hypothetical protein
VDFGGDDAATAAELTRDEDRLAYTQLLPVALGDHLGNLDLLKGRLLSWPGVSRVGRRKSNSQEDGSIAIATSISHGIVSQHPTEEHAI